MTSKERMLRALHREKPDRLPVTIHQWQQYHLDTYMDGCDALTAFQTTGMDAAIQYFEAMGQFWIPDAEKYVVQTPDWRDEIEVVNDDPVTSNKAFAIAALGCLIDKDSVPRMPQLFENIHYRQRCPVVEDVMRNL